MLKQNPAIKKSIKESNTILMKKKNKIQFCTCRGGRSGGGEKEKGDMTSRKIKGQWETKGQSTMANERSTKLKPKRSRKHRQTFQQSGGGKGICNYSQ